MGRLQGQFLLPWLSLSEVNREVVSRILTDKGRSLQRLAEAETLRASPYTTCKGNIIWEAMTDSVRLLLLEHYRGKINCNL